jgi:hypothetical protein
MANVALLLPGAPRSVRTAVPSDPTPTETIVDPSQAADHKALVPMAVVTIDDRPVRADYPMPVATEIAGAPALAVLPLGEAAIAVPVRADPVASAEAEVAIAALAPKAEMVALNNLART